MRTEIIDIKDISDSREVMMKKSPLAISVFISIIAVIVAVALVWACFGKIDTYVEASGEVRTKESISTITLANGGKIKNILLEDGAIVKKGDTIFECDSEYYEDQKQVISKQISNKKTEIDHHNKLIKAIETDKNLFDKEAETEFYYQFVNYRSELDATVAQITGNNKQITASKKELKKSIYQAKRNMKDTERLYHEFSKLYKAIDNNTKYISDIKSVSDIYNVYVVSRDKAQGLYDNSVLAYTNLLELQTANPNSVTKEEITQAEYAKSSALADLNSIKVSTLSEISSKLLELQNQIKAYTSNIEGYILKKDAMAFDETTKTTIEKIKNSYYLSISNTVKNINNEIDSLKTQLLEIDEVIKNCNIQAAHDGVLIYAQEIAVGDTINSGTTIASIVPNSNDCSVIIYIPEHNVSALNVGQKVGYSFASISITDFGKVYGEILAISNDSFTNQSNGQKYYKATASIEKTELTNKDGEKRNIKVGMLTEVNVITGTQSIMSWLLDKLNFI